MSLESSALERVARTIAQALEEIVEPLQREIARLNAELEALRSQTGTAPPAARVTVAPPTTLTAAATIRAAAARTAPSSSVAARTATAAAPTAAEESCLVPRCPAPVLAKSLCETHYRAMRRSKAAGHRFDPKKQKPASTRAVTRRCEEEGCREPHYAKDLCRKHYMTARARLRSAAQKGQPGPPASKASNGDSKAATFDKTAVQELAIGGRPGSGVIAMPTYEAVARVVAQYRGGLMKVAEVLGRDKRGLMELFEKLNMMEHVVQVRATERKRILAAPLRDRLSDLLFREKLLEDLGCLEEVDETTRHDIELRCAQLHKSAETQEEALQHLGAELGLDDAGLKRLTWRYDLRRQLRGLKARTPTVTRIRH